MKSLYCFSAVICCACTSSAIPQDIFEKPEMHLGENVTVCGFVHFALEDTNIWPNEEAQHNATKGLGILYYGRSSTIYSANGKTACISGTVIHTGCKSDRNKICNWSDYDYAVQISDPPKIRLKK